MNNRKILEDVYRDFFESDIKLEEKENKSNSENIPTLDNVFITEESKITVTMPEGTILVWDEGEGFIIPHCEVYTLEELKQEIEDIQEIYNKEPNEK